MADGASRLAAPPDVMTFERLLQEPEIGGRATGALFDHALPLALGRAPGRLDVMGGIADYSGSLTLELPLQEAVWVAAQHTPDPRVRVRSVSSDALPVREVSLPLVEVTRACESYASARAYFGADPAQSWVGYVLGALAALRVERGYGCSGGLGLLVAGGVPEGKGVSSSAALEVASLFALCELFGLPLHAVEAATWCQRVENLVVGAPCGIMDQMTASCGLTGQLLPLLCQPAELGQCFPVPSRFKLWGIDSGLRHQVSGADYTEVRVAAFMGYALIAATQGWRVTPGSPGQVTIEDPVYGGYLANVSSRVFRERFEQRLPERMSGCDFLRSHLGISDPVTRVRADASYRVRAATRHPIEEHERCNEFRALMLEAAADPGSAPRLGERLGALMYAAHDSYSACGLGSAGTDRLVELVREIGPERGLYGAKITGGGSGGTVAVLGDADASGAIEEVRRRYALETGSLPRLFSGSSPGAAAFGSRRAVFEAGCWRVKGRTA